MLLVCRPIDVLNDVVLNVVQLIYLPVTIEMMHLASIMPLRHVVASAIVALYITRKE